MFPRIVDAETREAVYDNEMNCAAVDPDHGLWAGSSDGLGRTRDNGTTWKVFRTFQPPGGPEQPQTYAYPNPFSPIRDNLSGDDGHVRFQYTLRRPALVTVRVYDFGMRLVATVVEGRDRRFSGSFSETWNGRNEIGDMVANGVYFYKVDISGESPAWGKVVVMN